MIGNGDGNDLSSKPKQKEQMKTVLIAVLMACAGTVHATQFDIGPAGTSYTRSFDFGQLNGITMNGQTVSFDLNFTNNIHLFAHTDPVFMLGFAFQTNGTNNTGFATGRGFILDGLGQPMCGVRPIACARSDDGQIFPGLFPLFADFSSIATDIGRPLDFYGGHFEFTFPDTGLTVTGGSFTLLALDFTHNGNRTNPFRVGPHVPDNGSTFLLFASVLMFLIFVHPVLIDCPRCGRRHDHDSECCWAGFMGKFDRTVKQTL